MTVKEHYDKHLAYFYSWMLGNFEEKMNDFLNFCHKYGITPGTSKNAIDLGAGNGIQSVALAQVGFKVKAVDFNHQLLAELDERKKELPIEIVHDDIRSVLKYKDSRPELIICCGDTISHLDSLAEIKKFIEDIFDTLSASGKLVLTFREYANELKDISRFIPVKSDSSRILTCFLEYFPEKVRVTDILHEKGIDGWQQKISSYEKVRISNAIIQKYLKEAGFINLLNKNSQGIITMIGQKNEV